ncbi:MAG: 2Fe-2S iron-sulfur cluster-binding protein [Planctomycetota bacterium]|nr:2Fe-2S iron-sulfur cluster-binding protein [Planctomycetota bacterium]MDA1222807.1 2Fe-2S iron-sulfur cluster-binding protein [Planctomycetota bacterium]
MTDAPDLRPPTGEVRLTIDGEVCHVPFETTVAAAIAEHRAARGLGPGFRSSVTGMSRGPLCGMGTCFECRARVDGRVLVRTCLVPCRDGMEVRTDG